MTKKPNENRLIRDANALTEHLFNEADAFLKARKDRALSFTTIAALEQMAAILLAMFADDPATQARGATAQSLLNMFVDHVKDLLALRGHKV